MYRLCLRSYGSRDRIRSNMNIKPYVCMFDYLNFQLILITVKILKILLITVHLIVISRIHLIIIQKCSVQLTPQFDPE
jgi:hypothetical protein